MWLTALRCSSLLSITCRYGARSSEMILAANFIWVTRLPGKTMRHLDTQFVARHHANNRPMLVRRPPYISRCSAHAVIDLPRKRLAEVNPT